MRFNMRVLTLLLAAAVSIQAATLVASIYGAYDAAGISVCAERGENRSEYGQPLWRWQRLRHTLSLLCQSDGLWSGPRF